jgi:hypothetical protein
MKTSFQAKKGKKRFNKNHENWVERELRTPNESKTRLRTNTGSFWG